MPNAFSPPDKHETTATDGCRLLENFPVGLVTVSEQVYAAAEAPSKQCSG